MCTIHLSVTCGLLLKKVDLHAKRIVFSLLIEFFDIKLSATKLSVMKKGKEKRNLSSTIVEQSVIKKFLISR